MPSDGDLQLKLDIYEGPLDLLLHLIKKNEVSLSDLPISLITAQYLESLEILRELNLDVAGDFLVMAATLTQIKSKMLAPGFQAEGEETEDPRDEIVGPLMEYLTIQEAALSLGERFLLGRDVFTRGNREDFEAAPAEETVRASLWDLVEAWRALASRAPAAALELKFNLETQTIGQRIEAIRAFLTVAQSAPFREVVVAGDAGPNVALSFLAVLELARVGFLRLYQDVETESEGPRVFLADPAARASLEHDYR
ncbi:MAG: segregation/condensation protein A [Deltaproteobacteria bacterium]|jgi:segregation and condensation protein A|nr:segregation/condensation protein A [Deltaproteobacteria bacterium]